jgi:hypothetical protein
MQPSTSELHDGMGVNQTGSGIGRSQKRYWTEAEVSLKQILQIKSNQNFRAFPLGQEIEGTGQINGPQKLEAYCRTT